MSDKLREAFEKEYPRAKRCEFDHGNYLEDFTNNLYIGFKWGLNSQLKHETVDHCEHCSVIIGDNDYIITEDSVYLCASCVKELKKIKGDQ